MATLVSPRRVIWANSGTPIFFPLLAPVLSADWQPVRWQMEVLGISSTTLRWAPGFRFSNRPDGDYLTPHFFSADPAVDTEGWVYGDGFLNISSPGIGYNVGRYVQFGIFAGNTSGTTLGYARARVLIDSRFQG
jgi:hypothetical protein